MIICLILELRIQLSKISDIKIQRWIQTKSSNVRIELHGFADASEMAYAALIYIKVIEDEQVFINPFVVKGLANSTIVNTKTGTVCCKFVGSTGVSC